jgi:hypothetical protein
MSRPASSGTTVTGPILGDRIVAALGQELTLPPSKRNRKGCSLTRGADSGTQGGKQWIRSGGISL